jgi:Rrf2 family transcriptional regulator, nitric oxide-sensitive transcriptional repressor
MRLTTFTDYTLRVLMYLALQPERRATILEIAAAYGISDNHLTKVVHHLGRSGTIETVRGKSGGLYIARALDTIRLGTVVRESEGEAKMAECMGEMPGSCCIAPACRLAAILEEALDALYVTLDRYSLADLVVKPRKLRGLLQIEA